MAKSPAEIGALARSHCTTAIQVVRGIMNNSETPPNVKLQAATILMDRGLGKPTQAIAIRGDPDSPVIFNLRLGDGMVNGGEVEVIGSEPLAGPLVAIATQDDTA